MRMRMRKKNISRALFFHHSHSVPHAVSFNVTYAKVIEAFNLEIGLLINFGNTRLEFRRLINSGSHHSKSLNH